MGRDRKKGKGGGRGGGGGSRMFIENEDELAIRNREINARQAARAKRRGEEDDDDEDEEGEENEQGEEQQNAAPDSVFAFERKSRAELAAERAAAAGPVGDEDDDEPKESLLGGVERGANPNRDKKPEKMMKVKDLANDDGAVPDPEAGMNRKEREALAAQKAKEDYMRRHLAGETEQARRELAQLAIVKARREAAQKKREAEGRPAGMSQFGIESDKEDDESSDDEEDAGAPKQKPAAAKPAATAAAAPAANSVQAKKKAAALAEVEETPNAADGGPPKLKSMDIKKMNADAVKEHLKARGLSIQGQKKDLMQRLIDYEAARA